MAEKWSGREDLNLRPQRPERCALNQAALLPGANILYAELPFRATSIVDLQISA